MKDIIVHWQVRDKRSDAVKRENAFNLQTMTTKTFEDYFYNDWRGGDLLPNEYILVWAEER